MTDGAAAFGLVPRRVYRAKVRSRPSLTTQNWPPRPDRRGGPSRSTVDRTVAAGEGGFAHRFGIGGVRVAGQGQILGCRAEFHRDADLVDQITRHWPDDMRAEDAVGLLVGKDLDEPLAREIRLGTAVSHEGELADLVGTPLIFQGFFGLADIGDLGMGVDHTGDDAIFHMAMLTGQYAGDGHAFVLGLVGEHGPFNGVADGVDALDIGLPVVVGLDLATLCHFDPEAVETEAIDIGFAACGDEDHIGVKLVFAVVLAQFVVDLGLGLERLDGLHGSAHDEFNALFFQDFLEVLLYLAIHAGGDRVEIFDHRHLRAEAGIDRAHLEPDDACTDHHHGLGHLGQFQRAGGGDDHLFVDLDAGQAAGFRARRDDDIAGLMGVVANLNLARLGDRAPALEP